MLARKAGQQEQQAADLTASALWRQRKMLNLLTSLCSSYWSGTPAHGMMSPMCRGSLSHLREAAQENPSQTQPEMGSHGDSKFCQDGNQD